MGNSHLASQFVSVPAGSFDSGALGTPMDFTTREPGSRTNLERQSLVRGRPLLRATKCPPDPGTGLYPFWRAWDPARGHGKGGKKCAAP